MKILIYSAAGFSDNTLPLYKAMKAKGVDVTLLFELNRPNVNLFNEKKLMPQRKIIRASEYQSFRRYEKYCDLDDVYVVNNPVPHQRNIKMICSTILVWQFIKERGFDVIHIDTPILMWKLPLLHFRKKIVLILHEPIPHARKQSFLLRFFHYINYKLISKLVVLNNSVHNQFCLKYGLKKEQVLVNRLGPLDCITVFGNYTGKFNPNKIVFWGRIAKYKGLEYLCQAMPIVHKKVPNAELYIYGGGDFYFDIEPYKMLPYFHIVNKYLDMEELAMAISDCAFTICPYVSSSQSGGVITSMVMQKPVIGSDFKTMHEMIENNITGLLVPPRNVEALANAIVTLLTDPEMLECLKRNIKNKINPSQSWSEIADKYIAFYQKEI